MAIKKLPLTVIVEAGFGKLAIRRNEACFGGAKIVLLIGGIKPRDQLTGLDRIADIDKALHDAPADPESEVDLNLAFDRAGKPNFALRLVLLHDYRPHRTNLGYRLLVFTRTGGNKYREQCDVDAQRTSAKR